MFHGNGVEDSSYGVREVQVFKLVTGLPTPSPLVSPSPTPTLMSTSTPTITPTTSITGTSTSTASPTLTPLPPVAGQNIAPYAQIYADNLAAQNCQPPPTPTGTPVVDVCNAIDNNTSTYWAPAAGSADPQGLNLLLASSQFTVGADTVNDIRVTVQSSGMGGSEVYEVSANGTILTNCVPSAPSTGYPDFTQIDCPIASPTPGTSEVSVLMFNANNVEDGSYGIREIDVYKVDAGFATPTPSLTSTSTPTLSPTNSPSSLKSPTGSPTLTATATPTSASSSTYTPTLTPTVSATPTTTPSTTFTATPTVTGVPPLRASSTKLTSRSTPDPGRL